MGPRWMCVLKTKVSSFYWAPAQIRENYRALIPSEDIIVYGTYGGIHGKTVYASEFLVSGAYRLFGIAEDVIRLQYFAECPLTHTTMYYTDFADPHRISVTRFL